MEMANCRTPLSSVSFSSTVRRSTVYTSAVEKFSNLFTLRPVQFSAQKLCLHLNRRLTQSFSFGSVVTVLGVFLFISIVSNPFSLRCSRVMSSSVVLNPVCSSGAAEVKADEERRGVCEENPDGRHLHSPGNSHTLTHILLWVCEFVIIIFSPPSLCRPLLCPQALQAAILEAQDAQKQHHMVRQKSTRFLRVDSKQHRWGRCLSNPTATLFGWCVDGACW